MFLRYKFTKYTLCFVLMTFLFATLHVFVVATVAMTIGNYESTVCKNGAGQWEHYKSNGGRILNFKKSKFYFLNCTFFPKAQTFGK